MKIFISYSTKEVSQFAKELKSNFKGKPGVAEVFICEEDVSAGEKWGQHIGEKLHDCDAFIPIITQEYLNSIPCYQEIHHAHYNKDKKRHIFPILIEDRKPEYEKGEHGKDIQLMVNIVQYTTFKTTKVEQDIFDKFLADIKQNVLGVHVATETAQGPTVEANKETVVSGNMAEEEVYESDLPVHVLDKQPPIEELITHARTGKWKLLGTKLKLDSVNLDGCHDLVSVYNLWIMEKARKATRRNLLKALFAIEQQNVLEKYEDYLRKLLVDNNL